MLVSDTPTLNKHGNSAIKKQQQKNKIVLADFGMKYDHLAIKQTVAFSNHMHVGTMCISHVKRIKRFTVSLT